MCVWSTGVGALLLWRSVHALTGLWRVGGESCETGREAKPHRDEHQEQAIPARSSANYGSPRINGLLVVPRGFYSELRVAAQQSIFSDKQLQTCRPLPPARRTGWPNAGARRGQDAGSALTSAEPCKPKPIVGEYSTITALTVL